MKGPWARIDDFQAGNARVVDQFDEHVSTYRIDEVRDVLEYVERHVDEGRWAYGYLAYEAAAGLDPTLPRAPELSQAGGSSIPLVWFGVTSTPPRPVGLVRPRGPSRVGSWIQHWSEAGYQARFRDVKAAIAAGLTYQCNLTSAVVGSFDGDALSLYAGLSRAQSASYCAYLDMGRHVIASASPELFFEWSGDRIVTKPMKGTAARGRSAPEDTRLVEELMASTKERAENIIIVDLLRNDLARIARTGSVCVEALLTPEAYPTVWQLTSRISARPLPGTGVVDVMSAMFPCGSVTGAPKAETMRIIGDLEQRRRGVYCGAIGWMAPPWESMRARFNVAIRTAQLDRATGVCEYGIGSGITWSSDAAAEFAELGTKARILTAANHHSLSEPHSKSQGMTSLSAAR